MHIEIKTGPFDPFSELQRYQDGLDLAGKYGATACFVGTMRDFNEGETVHDMTLDYYPGMTEKHLRQICDSACERWQLLDTLVIHRVGAIRTGEPIVLVSVWSGHRGDAFDACRFIMEDLKARAPFWKKERLDDGERWVEKNTSGYGK
ncbi:MAG: molybdenum cofactor biosynthesis protein MoaE [Gammaproteobacteria bacterium]